MFTPIEKFLRNNRYTLAVSIFFGISLAYIVRESIPVVSMEGAIVRQGDGSVIVEVYGTKWRGEECRYQGIRAYTLRSGFLHAASATRIDTPEIGDTKPRGSFNIGHWRVEPITKDSERVQIFVSHNCEGRYRTTKIADIQLYGSQQS